MVGKMKRISLVAIIFSELPSSVLKYILLNLIIDKYYNIKNMHIKQACKLINYTINAIIYSKILYCLTTQEIYALPLYSSDYTKTYLQHHQQLYIINNWQYYQYQQYKYENQSLMLNPTRRSFQDLSIGCLRGKICSKI